jgi:small subunit ribosomal protein S16
VGSKKNPIWRVVVADRRSPRDGRFIEAIGHYNPQTKPSTIVLDHERLDHWLALGAEPTNTVKKLMRAKDNPQVVEPEPAPEPQATPPREPEPEAEAAPEPAEETAPEPEAEAEAAPEAEAPAASEPDES